MVQIHRERYKAEGALMVPPPNCQTCGAGHGAAGGSAAFKLQGATGKPEVLGLTPEG